MPFVITSPLGDKVPETLRTTNKLVPQLLQELVMTRYLTEHPRLVALKDIATWIDQGKAYFQAATDVDWRSAGLLYYYSFLNFAKAYLAASGRFTIQALETTSLYHGLKAEAQAVPTFLDYQIQIFPPKQNNRDNVFAHFYELVTGSRWPYTDTIIITLRDIAGYCLEITAECLKLFQIPRKIFPCQSLLRISQNEVWFELMALKGAENIIVRYTRFHGHPDRHIMPEGVCDEKASIVHA